MNRMSSRDLVSKEMEGIEETEEIKNKDKKEKEVEEEAGKCVILINQTNHLIRI